LDHLLLVEILLPVELLGVLKDTAVCSFPLSVGLLLGFGPAVQLKLHHKGYGFFFMLPPIDKDRLTNLAYLAA